MEAEVFGEFVKVNGQMGQHRPQERFKLVPIELSIAINVKRRDHRHGPLDAVTD